MLKFSDLSSYNVARQPCFLTVSSESQKTASGLKLKKHLSEKKFCVLKLVQRRDSCWSPFTSARWRLTDSLNSDLRSVWGPDHDLSLPGKDLHRSWISATLLLWWNAQGSPLTNNSRSLEETAGFWPGNEEGDDFPKTRQFPNSLKTDTSAGNQTLHGGPPKPHVHTRHRAPDGVSGFWFKTLLSWSQKKSIYEPHKHGSGSGLPW